MSTREITRKEMYATYGKENIHILPKFEGQFFVQGLEPFGIWTGVYGLYAKLYDIHGTIFCEQVNNTMGTEMTKLQKENCIKASKEIWNIWCHEVDYVKRSEKIDMIRRMFISTNNML